MCAEWWSFEITQILAGLMGEVNLATQLITLQLVSVAFTVGNGIGVGKDDVGCHGGTAVPWRASTQRLKRLNCIAHLLLSCIGARWPDPGQQPARGCPSCCIR